ncbi:THAP domain-containing 1-like [Paramuricea clavata]|uniref:THAP domain-containing 1-like n=1 Tax=Paramuricea clavata TaxID=317549 RepID=A0A6S7I5H0_PARCT|nr:THAP domain-containing 1-like [Paramuricea clavata]
MKDKHALEQWEHFVQEANRPNILKEPWRATSTSRLCSDHFQVTDYITPPSVNGSCRLKKYVIPSKSHDTATMLFTIPNKTRCRLDLSNKRPIPTTDLENLSPPEKIAKTASTEEKRDELQTKLRQKIRNLQQQLRRSKQKVKTMNEAIKVLEERSLITSKEAESLQSTFENKHLQFLYNFKNLKASPSGRRYSDEIKEFAVTLYFYSPKAYKYVRSIIPLPNQSLIRNGQLRLNVTQAS